ncbi:MAG: agmatine deiminase family protein [bacterium]|nr:agmatine deiminase family protein [bacterium]
MHQTPRALGYAMPAEWARHEALWLAWPHDTETFPSRLAAVEQTYLQIMEAVHTGEAVHLLVLDEAMERRVAVALHDRRVDRGRIHFHRYRYADVWFRDYGPLFVTRKEGTGLAMVDWMFNAWGGKYETLMKDTGVPAFINETMKIPRFTPGLVMEGGSLEVNGAGVLMTTEQCLLNANRNPQLNRSQIEEALRDYLGVDQIIWLKTGIVGDDTDGHIDDIARFVSPAAIVCAFETDEKDANYAILRENYELLLEARDLEGARFDVIKLPMPQGSMDQAGGRLPASYANFYIANEKVLVPLFDDPRDKEACGILQELFTDRRIVGIDCRDLVHGLGTLHCISQQQPALF